MFNPQGGSQSTKFRLGIAVAFVSIMFVLVPGSASAASKLKLLHRFSNSGNDGYNPYDRPVLDEAGNLYGTTEFGGDGSECPPGCGVVFRLHPSNGQWQEIKYSLGRDTAYPQGGLVLDKQGHIYGTAVGYASYGSVFEVTYSGGRWHKQILYEFKGNTDGAWPKSTLILDTLGNLYGTTIAGGGRGSCDIYGAAYCGTVFKLAPNSTGGWTESLLYSFAGGNDGAYPQAGSLTFDGKGNLYGATDAGGGTGCTDNLGCGIVFKLSPNSDGSWTETILHDFSGGSDGGVPSGSLVFDEKGNLYGEAGGGGTFGDGVVFEMSGSRDGWRETVLYNFAGGSDGNGPSGGVVFDKAGNLYGSTGAGGNGGCYNDEGCGTVFELKPSSGGWSETVLYTFTGSNKIDGALPQGVILDKKGNLFGTGFDYSGGYYGPGTVFEITP